MTTVKEVLLKVSKDLLTYLHTLEVVKTSEVAAERFDIFNRYEWVLAMIRSNVDNFAKNEKIVLDELIRVAGLSPTLFTQAEKDQILIHLRKMIKIYITYIK